MNTDKTLNELKEAWDLDWFRGEGWRWSAHFSDLSVRVHWLGNIPPVPSNGVWVCEVGGVEYLGDRGDVSPIAAVYIAKERAIKKVVEMLVGVCITDVEFVWGCSSCGAWAHVAIADELRLDDGPTLGGILKPGAPKEIPECPNCGASELLLLGGLPCLMPVCVSYLERRSTDERIEEFRMRLAKGVGQ